MSQIYLKFILCFAGLLLGIINLQAQNVTITPNGITPALSSTYPRLSYDAILALPNPQKGDIAYDLTFECLRVYAANKWVCSYQDPQEVIPNVQVIAFGGGSGTDIGEAMVTDASGNIYVTGTYQNTASFGNIQKSSQGYNDIFLAKYNSSGQVQWVQSAGGTGDDYVQDIDIDASGNVYITGYYENTATFGSSSIGVAGSSTNIFVAKYNSDGSSLWVQSAGGIQSDYGMGIAVDANANVYITGYYAGSATFGGFNRNSVSGSHDIYIVKYNSAGVAQWAQSIGGTNGESANSIDTDANGNVYVTGSYSSTFTFGTTQLQPAGGSDVFVAKYTSIGAFVWVKSGGGTTADIGRNLKVDMAGNVYVTGFFTGTATFSPYSRPTAGGLDVFITRYDTNGTVLWLRSVGGIGFENSQGLRIDASGNIYITGSFNNTTIFDNISKISRGGEDIFITKYDSSGEQQWVKVLGGRDYDYGGDVAINNNGVIYVTGYYSGIVTFGNTKSTAAGADMFLIRLDQ